ENIFLEPKNYGFFLRKWNKYMGGYVNVWSYCLMPNHFHFLIRVIEQNKLDKPKEGNNRSLTELISNQFRSLFISYTKSFNKVYDHTGNLLRRRFKRKKVDSKNYLIGLIHYIHHNPIHHHFTNEYTTWEHSSYKAIIGTGPTKVKRNKVLKLFNGRNHFIKFHQEMKEYKQINHLIIE